MEIPDKAGPLISLARPLSKALYDHWNALRNGRPMPYRREVDPGRLRAFLPHLILLQQVAPRQMIFRLAGTSICAAFGRELRDHALISLWRASDRFLIEGAVSTALGQAAAAILSFEAMALERLPVAGEMTLLPLLDEDGAPTRLIGSIDFAPAPRKLTPKPYTRLELLSVARIAPARDRVVTPRAAEAAPARHALSLIEGGTAHNRPSLARPWSQLVQALWADERRD